MLQARSSASRHDSEVKARGFAPPEHDPTHAPGGSEDCSRSVRYPNASSGLQNQRRDHAHCVGRLACSIDRRARTRVRLLDAAHRCVHAHDSYHGADGDAVNRCRPTAGDSGIHRKQNIPGDGHRPGCPGGHGAACGNHTRDGCFRIPPASSHHAGPLSDSQDPGGHFSARGRQRQTAHHWHRLVNRGRHGVATDDSRERQHCGCPVTQAPLLAGPVHQFDGLGNNLRFRASRLQA